MKTLSTKVLEYKLYTYDDKYFPILKRIIKGDYISKKKFPSCTSSIVELIEIDNQKFIFKRVIIDKKRKKLLTFFRKCDCVKMFLATKKLQDKGFNELVDIYGAGVLKKTFVNDQFMLIKYSEARNTIKDEYSLPMDFLIRLHKERHFHGDVYPNNFMLDTENNLVVIDTRLKKMILGNIQAHRDMIHLFRSFNCDKAYPYKKNIFYYYCMFKLNVLNRL